MRVFVTGGAGFLGINLIRYLRTKGADVVSYDIAPFNYPEKDDVRAITGDVRDYATLLASMKGADAVVHCAMALPLYPKDDIRTTGEGGTRNVLEAAKELGIPRVVHVSSTAVYGIPDHHPLVEEDRLDGVGAYGKAKVAAEGLCADYRARGLVVPVVRPKSFVGPERLGIFALLYDFAATGHNFPMIGNGKNRYQLLDVEDLSAAIWLCLTEDAGKANDTFNVGAERFGTMREDYQAVLDRAGFHKKVIGFPAGPMILALRALEAVHLSPVYKWVYETASKDSFVSIDKAKRVLGYAPRYSNIDALLRNYEWYLAHTASIRGEGGVTHRVPWKQGALALAKLFF